MVKRTTLACAGLATDPNPYLTAAQGALRRADDVIFKHPEVASLRPGFPTCASDTSSRRVRAMHVFNGTPIMSSYDGATWSIDGVGGVISSSGVTPPDTSVSPMQFVEARSNLYLATSVGVKKMTGAAIAPVAAGLREQPSPVYTTTASGSAIPTSKAVAYRACVAKKDANGVETRNAPCPWFVVENTSGGTVDVTLTVMIGADVVAGDVIEVYRSLAVASGSTPSDMLFLAVKHTVTSSEVSAGLASVVDAVPELALGAELYTNGTREGALAANYPPPISVALALFAGCVWFGNTIERQTSGIRFKITTPAAATNPTVGISAAEANATGTSGTDTITIAVQTGGGLHDGMYVFTSDPEADGAYFQANTTITGISGSTITLSKNLIGSPAGAAVKFADRISVDGTNFFSKLTTSWNFGTKYFPIYSNLGSDPYGHGKMARIFAAVVSEQMSSVYAYGAEDPSLCGTVVLRRTDASAASFLIETSAPAGAIEALGADASFTSSAEDKPNRLYFSKPDEPEHVPVLNYLAIGEESAPIYALAKSRNALLVFKSDGVFKVTGSAPDRWRVDELDTATRLYRGSCVAEMNGLVYAWTNRGAVVVSELGVRNLSARAISRELDTFAEYMQDEPTTGGCFVSTWSDAGLVFFGVPSGSGSEITSCWYVYSETTGRWSRWQLAATCAAPDRDGASFYFARGAAWDIRYNSIGATAGGTSGYDHPFSLSGWTYTAGSTTVSITFAEAGLWVPKADDWLSCIITDPTYYRRITAVATTGTGYDLTIESAWPAGSQSGYMGYEAIVPAIEWQPATAGADPFTSTLWREMHVAMDFTDDSSSGTPDTRFELGASSERSTTEVPDDLKVVTHARAVPARRRRTLRAGIDREVGRATECSPYLRGSNVLLPWHCRGVTLVHVPDSGDAERGAR